MDGCFIWLDGEMIGQGKMIKRSAKSGDNHIFSLEDKEWILIIPESISILEKFHINLSWGYTIK